MWETINPVERIQHNQYNSGIPTCLNVHHWCKDRKLKLFLANQPNCHFAFSGEWALKHYFGNRLISPVCAAISSNSRNKDIDFVFEAMSSCSMTSFALTSRSLPLPKTTSRHSWSSKIYNYTCVFLLHSPLQIIFITVQNSSTSAEIRAFPPPCLRIWG